MSDKKLITPRIPSGFLELLPGEQIEFNNMIDKIKKSYEKFGFVPIETPAIEFSEVLLAKTGGETEKQVYTMTRGDKEYCLHFDLTVPLARYVSEHFNDLVFPFRRYQIQKVWRAERPQQGRFREFYQCDIDVIGSYNPFIDAELVGVINSTFSDLGIGNFKISINNRKIITGFLESIKLFDKSVEIMRIIDKADKLSHEDLIQEMINLDVDKKVIDKIFTFLSIKGNNQQIISQLNQLNISDELFLKGVEELSEVIQGINALGVNDDNYEIDLTIARGLDYYTGTVYETKLLDYPGFGSVCSGGRFDNLTSLYSDQSVPGVGISIGLTRLFSQLKTANLINPKASTLSKVIVIKTDNQYLDKCLEVATELRKNNINTEVYIDDDKLKKQFKYASRLGIENVIIVGEEEFNTNQVTLKDMNSGEQILLKLEDAIQKILN